MNRRSCVAEDRGLRPESAALARETRKPHSAMIAKVGCGEAASVPASSSRLSGLVRVGLMRR